MVHLISFTVQPAISTLVSYKVHYLYTEYILTFCMYIDHTVAHWAPLPTSESHCAPPRRCLSRSVYYSIFSTHKGILNCSSIRVTIPSAVQPRINSTVIYVTWVTPWLYWNLLEFTAILQNIPHLAHTGCMVTTSGWCIECVFQFCYAYNTCLHAHFQRPMSTCALLLFLCKLDPCRSL